MKKLLRVLVIAALLVAIAIPCLVSAEEHTHVWVGNGRTEATCTTDGEIRLKCSVAGCTATKTQVIAKLGHDFGTGAKVDTIVASTCKVAGTGLAHCTHEGCNETKEVTLPLADHKSAKVNPAEFWGQKPTCGKDGWEALTYCSNCGDVLTKKTLPATGNHNYQRATIKESTCSVAGYTALKCTVCNHVDETSKIELPLADHTFGDLIILDSEATCTAPEMRHAICSKCGAAGKSTAVGTKLAHDWSASTVDKQPTCDEKGSKHWTCKRCGEVLTEEIPVHTPEWSKGIIDKEPTCLEEGSKHWECKKCGKVLKTEALAKLEHKPVWTVVEPTCTEAGTSTKTCTECGTVLEVVTSPATGHKEYEWKITKEALACKDGEMAYVCKKCGDVKETKVIKATGKHTPSKEAQVIKAATCTEDGEKAIVCTVCGDVVGTVEKIPATGHKAGEYTQTKAPTCTEKGEEVSKCTVCNAVVDTREVAAKGHVAGEWITVRQPSASQNGKMIQKCTVCGAQIGKKYIRANGSADTAAKTVAYVAGAEVANYAKIDLTVDATTELDLVSANGTKVGKLVVEVKEGKVTVKYELSAVPADAFLTFVAEAPSKDIHAEKEFEFEKAISVADELAGAAAAYIYVEIEY